MANLMPCENAVALTTERAVKLDLTRKADRTALALVIADFAESALPAAAGYFSGI
jgi:hypothetical protein